MRNKRYQTVDFWISTVLGLAFFAAGAVWVLHGVREAAAVSRREELRMAEQAVREAAVSIYALEGAYPASYEALRERSGIAVDEDKYTVFYDIFASNIMPEITVLAKGGEP